MGLDENTRFDLKISAEYVVYGLTTFLCHTWYYIADESYSHFPVWNPASLFEVTDSRLSRFWIAGYQSNGPEGDPSLLIAFPEWINDHTFYSRLTEGDAEAVAVFETYKRRLDNEFAPE